MSADSTTACRAEDTQPYGAAADERGCLGTLSWRRAAKIASLAAAVAALTALSLAAGPPARVVGPPDQARSTSVVTPQRAPAPAP